MTGEVGLRVRELIREICGNQEVTIAPALLGEVGKFVTGIKGQRLTR